MGIEYQFNEPVRSEVVSELFERSGIRRPVGDFNRIQRMLGNADEIITAWDTSELAGIIRAVTDYSYCCYISDLAASAPKAVVFMRKLDLRERIKHL